MPEGLLTGVGAAAGEWQLVDAPPRSPSRRERLHSRSISRRAHSRIPRARRLSSRMAMNDDKIWRGYAHHHTREHEIDQRTRHGGNNPHSPIAMLSLTTLSPSLRPAVVCYAWVRAQFSACRRYIVLLVCTCITCSGWTLFLFPDARLHIYLVSGAERTVENK